MFSLLKVYSIINSTKVAKNYIFNVFKLGVRSLANASRARQFNPLNPPGVGWVPLPQTNMAAVVGRARVVGHAWSCVVVRGRACVVGHSWSCAVVPFCPLRGQHCRNTNERTNEGTNNI